MALIPSAAPLPAPWWSPIAGLRAGIPARRTRARYRAAQAGRTFWACRPFCPRPISNSTRASAPPEAPPAKGAAGKAKAKPAPSTGKAGGTSP
ncbi:MAG: hypothetical protein EOP32_39915 [Rhodococcus sp. (in: high G+C Gram-positive bacteria)]|nr:MAG: hypothetical protein EOP32_39915 [Rhodococcus sp. (in: high G+C Gram-positive bacteria)]